MGADFRKTKMLYFLEKLKCYNNSLHKFLLKNKKKMLHLKKNLNIFFILTTWVSNVVLIKR